MVAYNILSYNILFIFTIWPIIFTIIMIYNDIVCVDNYKTGKYITFEAEREWSEWYELRQITNSYIQNILDMRTLVEW